MGYTAAFEPALSPVNARQSHLEMGDTPIIDKGGYAMIGSDDFFLRMLAAKKDQKAINDYVGWVLHASQAIGIKVVNPGGISAFKFNQRALDLDEQNSHYQVTPREVLQALSRAVHELGVPHPLHVHGNNLGVPGNVETTLKTMGASEGYPLHLTHIQFHSYGTEGDRKFSSGAAQIAEAINKHKHISADVGQILFNQTVTASGDNMRQFANSTLGSPRKSVIMDIECDSGCGVVPFKYKDQNFVNALQWAIGLEIFLLTDDPWRIFLTTDHPNGAPFTSYPHLIRLLMDKGFRNDMFTKLNLDAQAMSTLNSIDREYSLYEIAIMTRAGAARLVGLHDRGHLEPDDAVIDIELELADEPVAHLAQGEAVPHGHRPGADETFPTGAQAESLDRAPGRVWAIQHPHAFAGARRRLQHIAQGGDEGVDAAAEVLQIDQQHVEAVEHPRRGLAHRAVQAEHRNAERRVDLVRRLHHVVLLVAAQAVLRAEGGGEVNVAAGGKDIQAVLQVGGDRGGMGQQGDAAALQRRAQAGVFEQAIDTEFHDHSRAKLSG